MDKPEDQESPEEKERKKCKQCRRRHSGLHQFAQMGHINSMQLGNIECLVSVQQGSSLDNDPEIWDMTEFFIRIISIENLRVCK